MPSDPVVAYQSWGRWVAQCPNPACTNAMGLERDQVEFHCWIPSGIGVCGTTAPIDWPANADEVEQAMALRAPQDQSWRPGEDL